MSKAEVTRQGGRGEGFDRDPKPLAVRRGDGAAAPPLGQGETVVVIDEEIDGLGQRCFAQMPGGGPGNQVFRQVGHLSHACRAEIPALREERAVKRREVGNFASMMMGEVSQGGSKVDPAAGFNQQFRQIHAWKPFGNHLFKGFDRRRAGFGIKGSEHQPMIRIQPNWTGLG